MKQMDMTSAAVRQSLVFDAVRDVAAIIGRQDGSGKVMHAKDWIPLLHGQCTSRSDFASILASLEGGVEFYDQNAQMHLVVFVEELVRSRGAVLNMPSWFNAYTRGLSLKKQELVSELVAAKHDTEARLRDTKQYGMYELLLAWLPHQVGRVAYQAWLGPIHRVPDFFWVEREARWGRKRKRAQQQSQPQPQPQHGRNRNGNRRLFKSAGPRFHSFN